MRGISSKNAHPHLNGQKEIVVIGGGTGSFVVLSGLKKYPYDLTAIVAVTDSGGSTGRLRTEFGFLPVGDMRQCLAALSVSEKNDYIRKLLLYRFSKGKGLKGHNLGNLILTGLTDICASEAKAMEIAAGIFRLNGKIYPVTTKNVQLVAEYESGLKIFGEHAIDEPKHKGGLKIVDLKIRPKAVIYQKAKEAILTADLIVIGPGDLYTSIFPNLIVKGVGQAIKKSKAVKIYVLNLMTRFSQTHNLTAKDHVREIEKYLGQAPDYVLLNKQTIPAKILNLYKKEKGFPIIDDLKANSAYKIKRCNLLKAKIIRKKRSDQLERSYLRHDSKKLAKAIIGILRLTSQN